MQHQINKANSEGKHPDMGGSHSYSVFWVLLQPCSSVMHLFCSTSGSKVRMWNCRPSANMLGPFGSDKGTRDDPLATVDGKYRHTYRYQDTAIYICALDFRAINITAP